MSEGIQLIAGLGNPGRQYRFTRHNAGALFLETLCHDYRGELRPESKFSGDCGRITIAGNDVRLIFPTTMMNLSGRAVAAISQYYRIAPENILVAYDELDLPVGTVRLKTDGGAGGHNGIKDIINALGSPNFHRLRIGIGRPTQKGRDYVLSEPSKAEADAIQQNIDEAISLLPLLVEGRFQDAMQQLHTNPGKDVARKRPAAPSSGTAGPDITNKE